MNDTTRTISTTGDAGPAGPRTLRTVLWIALAACVVGNTAVSWLDGSSAVAVVLRAVTAVAGAVVAVALIRRRR